MIIREFYKTRQDGINLYICYSDKGVYIQKEGSPMKHEKVVQIENSDIVYIETDVKIVERPNKSKERIHHVEQNS